MPSPSGQVLVASLRVHDSQGAKHFILPCIGAVPAAFPGVAIEVRMDSAFCSDENIGSLNAQGVAYTVSVPFERFTALKKHWAASLVVASWVGLRLL